MGGDSGRMNEELVSEIALPMIVFIVIIILDRTCIY